MMSQQSLYNPGWRTTSRWTKWVLTTWPLYSDRPCCVLLRTNRWAGKPRPHRARSLLTRSDSTFIIRWLFYFKLSHFKSAQYVIVVLLPHPLVVTNDRLWRNKVVIVERAPQMDVLLYCLELDEMLDYDSMKSNNSSPEKSLSRSFENLSTKTSDAGAEKAPTFSRSVTDGNLGGGGKPVIIPKNDVSSNTLVPPPPSSQPRYHPYEEIFIPPRTQQPPKPPVSRKPSVETRPKPKPAPRRSQAPKQTIVTDLWWLWRNVTC